MFGPPVRSFSEFSVTRSVKQAGHEWGRFGGIGDERNVSEEDVREEYNGGDV